MSVERLVVGITGSSGVILGIRLLQALQGSPIETHLVVTQAARVTIEQETNWQVEDVLALAGVHYSPRDIGAAIASGSFATRGMVVIPCSIKSLSSIANSYAADLLTRAADVTLKEGRPLLLVVRETPLHRGHIRLMDQAAAAGAVIFPPVPAFYTHPHSVDDLVDNLVGRVLARLGIENELYQRWQGAQRTRSARPVAVGDGPAWPPPDLLALPAMTLATSGSPDSPHAAPGAPHASQGGPHASQGGPHAAPVYFAAAENCRLYFFSDPNSQHALDLQTGPRAAAAIYPLVPGWQEIRGLQLRGKVRAVPPGAEWDQAWDLYRAKFPFVEQLRESVARTTLYAFEPDWIRLVDNRQGLGWKEEREV